MINPWIIIAVLLAILSAGAGGFKLGADHELAAQAREDKHVAKAVEAATAVSAQAISQIRPKYSTIQGQLIKEIQTNTVFKDCKLDGASLKLVNEALASPFGQKVDHVESAHKPSGD